MRRVIALSIFTIVALFGATAAFGAWLNAGSGSGTSLARAQGLPTSATATATGTTSISTSWSTPTGGSVTPTQYVVRRTAPTTATVCTVGGAVFTCNDTGLTAGTTYTYTVEARIGSNWSSGQTAGFSATTNSAGTFIVAPGPAVKTAGTAFSTTITATTNGVTTDTSYTGSHAITFSGPSASPSGQAPTYPATVNFVAGVGTASITLYNVETVSLGATDGTLSGSASVTVVAGASNQLRYTSSSISCTSGSVIVGNGGSFTSKVTVYDAYLNPVPQASARTVSLTRSSATGTLSPTSLTIASSASETSTSFTFTLPNGNPPDTTITASSSGVTSTACIVKKN